jgi:hypothetical protein
MYVCNLSVWHTANNIITYPDMFSHNKMGAAKEVQAPKIRQSQGLVQLLVLESAEEVAGRKARYAGGRHSR